MKQFIYADNAATTKLDMDAFSAMEPFFLEEYGNPSQMYSFSRKPKLASDEARAVIARCINSQPDEIYFTSGGTESNNWAIKCTDAVRCGRGKIITSRIEHHSVLRACEFAEKSGNSAVYLPVSKEGIVTAGALSSVMDSDVKLVSVMLANNEIGTIEPVKILCEIAQSFGAVFHTDAVQAVGHINVDVRELGVDMLSASAHKFNGPKGIGFLYIKKGTPVNAFINGGAQEYGIRAGTQNVASIVGMSTALKKNCDAIRENSEYLLSLEDILLDRLNAAGLDFIRNGSKHHIPGNISLSFNNSDGELLLHRLDLMGIAVSSGAACNSSDTVVSHVIKAIGSEDNYAKGTIRISLGKNNTPEEVKIISERLVSILRNNRI